MSDKKTKAKQPEFAIQRIYAKDVSFEAPHVPEIFKTDWEPDINIDLNVKVVELETDVNEVTLKIIVTVKLKDKIAFLVEVNQAGIFTVQNFPKDQLKPMLESFCPNVLFPYARERIADLVSHASFPPLHLAPVNFEALYQQQMEEAKEGKIVH